jgi:hypothetical protein
MSWEGETSKVVNLHHHSKYESKILKSTWTSSNPRRKSRWLLLRVIFGKKKLMKRKRSY